MTPSEHLNAMKTYGEDCFCPICEEDRKPTIGFFAALTSEQQKAALEYRGEENHGEIP